LQQQTATLNCHENNTKFIKMVVFTAMLYTSVHTYGELCANPNFLILNNPNLNPRPVHTECARGMHMAN